MRTEMNETTYYRFDELDTDVQKSVLEHMKTFDGIYPDYQEQVNSLKLFCEHFELENCDYHIAPFETCTATANISSELPVMVGEAVYHYLRESGLLNCINSNKLTILEDTCPFTGVYFDEALLSPLREFMANPDEAVTLKNLFDQCLDGWAQMCREDVEYVYSDEAITASIEANDYEFLASGELA